MKSNGAFKAALKAAAKKAAEAERKVVRVGFHEHQHYPDGTPVAAVAAVHEYGTATVPARPFMRPTLKDKGKEWGETMKAGLEGAVTGQGMSVDAVLEAVGMLAASDIQAGISAVTSPALKPATIKARNRKYKSKSKDGNVSAKPLIDTGLMHASVSHVVTEKE